MISLNIGNFMRTLRLLDGINPRTRHLLDA